MHKTLLAIGAIGGLLTTDAAASEHGESAEDHGATVETGPKEAERHVDDEEGVRIQTPSKGVDLRFFGTILTRMDINLRVGNTIGFDPHAEMQRLALGMGMGYENPNEQGYLRWRVEGDFAPAIQGEMPRLNVALLEAGADVVHITAGRTWPGFPFSVERGIESRIDDQYPHYSEAMGPNRDEVVSIGISDRKEIATVSLGLAEGQEGMKFEKQVHKLATAQFRPNSNWKIDLGVSWNRDGVRTGFSVEGEMHPVGLGFEAIHVQNEGDSVTGSAIEVFFDTVQDPLVRFRPFAIGEIVTETHGEESETEGVIKAGARVDALGKDRLITGISSTWTVTEKGVAPSLNVWLGFRL